MIDRTRMLCNTASVILDIDQSHIIKNKNNYFRYILLIFLSITFFSLYTQFLSWAKVDGNDTLTKFETSSSQPTEDDTATKDSKMNFENFYKLSMVNKNWWHNLFAV